MMMGKTNGDSRMTQAPRNVIVPKARMDRTRSESRIGSVIKVEWTTHDLKAELGQS